VIFFTSVDVAFGSVVTLKSRRPGGALLHSHSHLYPEDAGPVQQQITAYSHKDDNNKWLVKKPDREYNESTDPVEFVVAGSIIRLEHIMTKRNLHSHKEKAPLTKSHFQASGYGKDGIGDANDNWVVEIVGGKEGERVKTVSSAIRLRHLNVGCYLFTHSEQLPKWGWEQHEVTCSKQISDPNTLWNVEGHVNHRLPNVSGDFYKPSFLRKFIESHIVMTESNSNLKPKEGEITSQPWQWPINLRGQSYSGGDYRVYMLGNPVVFWFADAMIVIFLITFLIKLLLDKRRVVYDVYVRICIERYIESSTWMFLAWALHYAPFFLMGRVLYFHHYFPAFVFQCMLAGSTIEFCACVLTALCKRSAIQGMFYHTVVMTAIGGIIYSFILFMPMSYGMHGPRASDPNSTMYGLKWLETWDI
jgi:dolichyl-phosphate-mannose-protein mannosyltransferase